MRALEKVVTQLHVPSSAAGNVDHLTFIMGDWNTWSATMPKAINDAITAANASGVRGTTITARNAVRRDHAFISRGNRTWSSRRDDEIPDETYQDLKACTGEHHSFFFSIEARFDPEAHFDPPDVQIPQRPERPPPTNDPIPASTRQRSGQNYSIFKRRMQISVKTSQTSQTYRRRHPLSW